MGMRVSALLYDHPGQWKRKKENKFGSWAVFKGTVHSSQPMQCWDLGCGEL